MDVALEFPLPIVARLQLLPIEKRVYPGLVEGLFDVFDDCPVFAGVTEKDRPRRQIGSRGYGIGLLRVWNAGLWMFLDPPVVKLVDEPQRIGVAVDFGRAREAVKKQDQVFVTAYGIVGNIVGLVVGGKR